jgi:hypothetical protein
VEARSPALPARSGLDARRVPLGVECLVDAVVLMSVAPWHADTVPLPTTRLQALASGTPTNAPETAVPVVSSGRSRTASRLGTPNPRLNVRRQAGPNDPVRPRVQQLHDRRGSGFRGPRNCRANDRSDTPARALPTSHRAPLTKSCRPATVLTVRAVGIIMSLLGPDVRGR